MKKFIIAFSLLTAGIGIFSKANAQVSVQVNIGGVFSAAIKTLPAVVAPAPEMAADPAAYYYYDDINCYYDRNQGLYIYPYDNVWYYTTAVPPMFRNYDFQHARYSMVGMREFRGRNIRPLAYAGRPMNSMDRNNQMVYGRNNPMYDGYNRNNGQAISRDRMPQNNNTQFSGRENGQAMASAPRTEQNGNYRSGSQNNGNVRTSRHRSDARF